MKNKTNTIISYFSEMEDFRINRKKRHLLIDIITITIAATLSGCQGFDEIEDFGIYRENWFGMFLELPNGIPSHDTFNRVFSKMNPLKFEQCFRNWVNAIIESKKEQLISIDGKTIRGAKTNGIKSPIHMVSAWSSENNMVLGQVKVNEKSNEITAIPELLETLFIEQSIVSIDAMGCQEEIAKKIIKEKADYILAVKHNQQTLFENIEDSFRFLKIADTDESHNVDHGRVETRKCSIIKDLSHIEQTGKWKNLNVLIKIETQTYFKINKKTETATRYYIASKNETAKFYQKNVRNHWGIENKLHWCLDVVFQEDNSRKRNENLAQNFSLINKIALNILKNETSKKCSINRKRRQAVMDTKYLEKMLGF